MPFRNLQTFVSYLDEKKDLCRIKKEVDPVLEMTEIASRMAKVNGPALFFEKVKGSSFPAVMNILGADRRIEWALGQSPSQLGSQLAHMAEDLNPPSPRKLWKHRKSIFRALSMRNKKVFSPPVLNNSINPAQLDRLPVAQSWPKDGGRFITFPLVVTRNPVDGKQNMGIYRMHVYSPTQTGMHWQIAKGGGYHYQQAETQNQNLPVAVVVGADPILMLCGVLPLPEGMDEMAFSGFLRGETTRVTSVHNGHLTVPAEAEFILEGVVPPHDRRSEGPYGDHFGHYSLASDFPIFNIQKIHHRPGAIYPITVVGKPPQEDQVLGDAVQELLLPLLKVMHPEVVDLWAYQEAGFHNLLVASVKQRFQKEAIKTALWILGEGQLALSKCVILVDPDVNARDFKAVLKAIRSHFDPAEDFILLPSTSQDTLDFTSFKMNLGSKMILDATSSPSTRVEKSKKPMAINWDQIKMLDPHIKDGILLENSLMVLQVEGNARKILEKMITLENLASIPIVAAVSPDVPLNDPVLLLWGLFTRFDCARDTFFAQARLENGHPVYGGPMAVDATWKKGYPEPLTMTEEIIRLVDQRWKEYEFSLPVKV